MADHNATAGITDHSIITPLLPNVAPVLQATVNGTVRDKTEFEATCREEDSTEELKHVKEAPEEEIIAMKQHVTRKLEQAKEQGNDTNSEIAVFREKVTAGRKIVATFELLEKIILSIGPNRYHVLDLTRVNRDFSSVIHRSNAIQAMIGLQSGTSFDGEHRSKFAPDHSEPRLSAYFPLRPGSSNGDRIGTYKGVVFTYGQSIKWTNTVSVTMKWPKGFLPGGKQWSASAYLSEHRTFKEISVTTKKTYPGKKEFEFSCSVLSKAETVGEVFLVAEELVAGCPALQHPDAPWCRETLLWTPRSILDVPSTMPEAIDLMIEVPEYAFRRIYTEEASGLPAPGLKLVEEQIKGGTRWHSLKRK